jgi:hypothetical protein
MFINCVEICDNCLINYRFLLQIEVVILALAVIISAEGGKFAEEDVNSQTKKEDSTLEHAKDEISLGKEELKQKQEEINKQAENEENILKHKEKITEFEGHQENEQSAKPEQCNQGLQLQDEENRKAQHTGQERHLNVDMKQTQGEAETTKLQHDVKEMNKKENDAELEEKKHTNQDEVTPEQAEKLNSVGEHSDQQTAQNNGLEISQQLEHVLQGYRVTEPGQDEEHQLVTQNGFNYLFSSHGGHNLQHSSSIFGGTSLSSHHDIQTLALANEAALQHHFPVYIPDERHVPHPAVKTIPYPAQHPVSRPVPIPVTVHKAVPYTVHKPVPYPVKVPVERPYFVPVPVEKKVPFAVHVKVPVPQPYTVHVPKPYTVLVEKKVPAPYPVRVEIPVSQPYPVKVNVPVPIPVDRPVPVPVEKPYPVTVQKEFHHPVDKKAPYPVKVRTASSILSLTTWTGGG